MKPLKSLDDITDEDALKVAEILGGTGSISDEAKIHQVKEVLKGRFNKVTNIPGIAWCRLFEYLKKNGYKIE